MNELVKAYLSQTIYNQLDTVEGSKGKCDGVSRDLQKFLSSKGIQSEIIEGIGLIPELHETAHEDWQQFKGKDQKFLAHVVVKIDDTIIDLTFAQFNENDPFRILPLSAFKNEWKKLKKLGGN